MERNSERGLERVEKVIDDGLQHRPLCVAVSADLGHERAIDDRGGDATFGAPVKLICDVELHLLQNGRLQLAPFILSTPIGGAQAELKAQVLRSSRARREWRISGRTG